MATYNVTTAQQLIEAIVNAHGNDVININSDLEWNDVVENLDYRIQLNSGVDISNLTINGNDHAIYNLTSGSIPSIGVGTVIFDFGSSTNINIYNLSFLNCNMGGKSTRIIRNSGSCTIHNSVIQGKFKTQIFYGSGVVVKDSMITANDCEGRPFGGDSGQNTKWRYCWIHLKRCSWTYQAAGYFGSVDGCYIEGTLSTLSPVDDMKIIGTANNCCINLRMELPNETPTGFLTPASGDGGQFPNIINVDKITQLAGQDDTTWIKLVTDEQMKDADYLASIGFNIIP